MYHVRHSLLGFKIWYHDATPTFEKINQLLQMSANVIVALLRSNYLCELHLIKINFNTLLPYYLNIHKP